MRHLGCSIHIHEKAILVMIRKRSLLCGCEVISSHNVCTKLAIQFLLSVNCQANILLCTKGHSQVHALSTGC